MNASSAVQFGSLLREAGGGKVSPRTSWGPASTPAATSRTWRVGGASATPEVIEFLSRRLGVSPLEWGVSPAGDPRQLVAGDTIEDLLVAERAWSEHDWAAAILHSTQAAATRRPPGTPAGTGKRSTSWPWRSSPPATSPAPQRWQSELAEHETAQQVRGRTGAGLEPRVRRRSAPPTASAGPSPTARERSKRPLLRRRSSSPRH